MIQLTRFNVVQLIPLSELEDLPGSGAPDGVEPQLATSGTLNSRRPQAWKHHALSREASYASEYSVPDQPGQDPARDAGLRRTGGVQPI